MKKLLLAVLLLWMATLVFPAWRERAEPRVTAVRGWVWERTQGPLTPVRDRYLRTRAESDLNKVIRSLVMQRNLGQQAPRQEDLRSFMARNDIVDDGLDPWGVPYLIVQEADSVAIISAGPDLTYHTEDDIVVRVRYARRDPPRRTFPPLR